MSTNPDHDTRRPEQRQYTPACESLEGRALLSVTAGGGHGGHVPRSFLFTPIVDGTPLAEHIHPHLTIIVNGQSQTVPEGIGIGLENVGNLPIHTHTSDGTLHVESTEALPFRLSDFFTIWGQVFNKRDILGHRAGHGEKITMTVDGRPSNQFGNLLLQDHQQIVITYGPAKR